MKAFSPVRSAGRRSSSHSVSDPGLPLGGIARSKAPADGPSLRLLDTMNDCYSKLKELVPSIPQDRKVSKMEILQHVIDYILDLQLALDSARPARPGGRHRPRPGPGPAANARTPLTTLNTDISILSLQVAPACPPPAHPPAPWGPPGVPPTISAELGGLQRSSGNFFLLFWLL